MDTIESYRSIVKQILAEYAEIPYAYGKIEAKTIFDCEKDRYILMTVGWQNKKRIHGCLIHIDIIDEKIWIQRDGTEYGIAVELEKAGVPKKNVVLGFHSPDIRKHTEYAFN